MRVGSVRSVAKGRVRITGLAVGVLVAGAAVQPVVASSAEADPPGCARTALPGGGDRIVCSTGIYATTVTGTAGDDEIVVYGGVRGTVDGTRKGVVDGGGGNDSILIIGWKDGATLGDNRGGSGVDLDGLVTATGTSGITIHGGYGGRSGSSSTTGGAGVMGIVDGGPDSVIKIFGGNGRGDVSGGAGVDVGVVRGGDVSVTGGTGGAGQPGGVAVTGRTRPPINATPLGEGVAGRTVTLRGGDGGAGYSDVPGGAGGAAIDQASAWFGNICGLVVTPHLTATGGTGGAGDSAAGGRGGSGIVDCNYDLTGDQASASFTGGNGGNGTPMGRVGNGNDGSITAGPGTNTIAIAIGSAGDPTGAAANTGTVDGKDRSTCTVTGPNTGTIKNCTITSN